MNERLQNSIEDYLDGELTDQDLSELIEALTTCEEAQREFVLRSHLHRQLHDTLQNGATQFIDAELLPLTRAQGWPSPDLAPVEKNTSFWPGWHGKWHSLAAAIVLVGAVFYGTFTLIAWNLKPAVDAKAHLATAEVERTSPLATLTNLQDCRWEANSSDLVVGAPLMQETLRLAAGVAEVTFADGARVTLQGPAHLEIESASRSYLHRGQLVARVPAPAIGFMVQTDSATVIDLGTEFAVSTDEHGQTDVQVIEGKIEVRPSSKGSHASSAQPPITLTAGSARRIELTGPHSEPTVREIAPDPSRVVSQIKPTGPIRLPIEGAMASSEFGRREAKYLIDGSGLKGDRHAIDPDRTMWHSALGRVQGEFVLFDLGRPRRLHSLKVWNYNEAMHEGAPNDLFTSRGVGQADIYVSMFGHGDPLSQPSEWRLLIADHKFAAADGTPDYATPEVILLHNVEARFVAIVVDDHLAPDPRPPATQSQEAVGLSEVQIFGELVKPRAQPVSK